MHEIVCRFMKHELLKLRKGELTTGRLLRLDVVLYHVNYMVNRRANELAV